MVGLLAGDVVACPIDVPPFAVPTWPDARDGYRYRHRHRG